MQEATHEGIQEKAGSGHASVEKVLNRGVYAMQDPPLEVRICLEILPEHDVLAVEGADLSVASLEMEM
jgi:hypothetical protein